MIQFGSIRISGEHISGVGSGMGLGRSTRISDLGLILSGLLFTHERIGCRAYLDTFGFAKSFFVVRKEFVILITG